MLVLANVLWSLNYATTKYAFRAWNPLAFAAIRFMLAGALFASFVRWREGSLSVRRADMRLVVAAAAVGILGNQLTFNYAVENTTAGNTALFAMTAGHERVGRRHWLALGVSVAGVALVVQGGAGVRGAGYLGDLLAVGAALTWAAYSVMLRPLFERYSASRVSALMIVLGGVMLLPFGLPQMVTQDWGSLRPLHVGAFAYSAIFPLVVTNVLYFRSLRRIGASRATLYMYLQPFLAVMFAALLIGERVTLVQVLGGVVIVAGVSLGKLFPGATVRE
jgi:drug/metabolite transporter (DMT)-like permease